VGNAGHYRPCGWDCRNRAPAWGQGAFPSIADDGTPINGGVPQAANLSRHLGLLAEQIPIFVTDPLFSGLAVFDWEAWTPVWENNAHPTNYHGKRYSDLSVQLVKDAHPDWPAAKVNAEAKATFQQAAVNFIVRTLELCARLRPKALWGFYGMESSLEVSSDVMVPIYLKSKALFPDIYVSQAPASAEQRRAAVLSTVAAAVNTSEHLAASGGPRIPVYPFAWECYHNGSTLLSDADLQSEIIEPYNAGASGVVVWGYTAGKVQGGGVYGPVRWRSYLHYVANKTGPLVAQFRQRAADCARADCSGHGRCAYVAPLPPTETKTAAAPSCSCDPGWGGVDCSQRVS
jgi:hyaluronoglucosaminidase